MVLEYSKLTLYINSKHQITQRQWMMSSRVSAPLVQSLHTDLVKSTDSSSTLGSSASSKHKLYLHSMSSNVRTCRGPKTKQGKPSDSFARVGSSASGRALVSPKANRSVEHTFSRTTRAPEGCPKIKDAFSRASSSPSCTLDDEGLCKLGLTALEALETLKCIVSSRAGSSSCEIPRLLGPHSALPNNSQRRANNTFVVDKENSINIRQLSRHFSLPTSNTAVNVMDQDLVDRSSARKRVATRTSSSESRGTRQMVAFCERERLKARFSNTKAHSGILAKRPAKPPGSPPILSAFHFQAWLVLCLLLVTLWAVFSKL